MKNLVKVGVNWKKKHEKVDIQSFNIHRLFLSLADAEKADYESDHGGRSKKKIGGITKKHSPIQSKKRSPVQSKKRPAYSPPSTSIKKKKK